MRRRGWPAGWLSGGRIAVAGTALAMVSVGVLGLTAADARPETQVPEVQQTLPPLASGTVPLSPAAAPAPSAGDAGVAGEPAGITTVATVLHASPRYALPGVRAAGKVPAEWWLRPSVLPVIAARPGWVKVRLAQRPNGSTAWLPASDVRLSTTPYRIVINLATTHLSLYENGQRVLSAPAGVGAQDDPTPTGHYFVAFSESPPGPGYGPFVLLTSVHSDSIRDWEGSGDASIGIHGPLGEDAQIGTTGARISHGCIRLHLSALAKLAGVPAGTPIDVVG